MMCQGSCVMAYIISTPCVVECWQSFLNDVQVDFCITFFICCPPTLLPLSDKVRKFCLWYRRVNQGDAGRDRCQNLESGANVAYTFLSWTSAEADCSSYKLKGWGIGKACVRVGCRLGWPLGCTRRSWSVPQLVFPCLRSLPLRASFSRWLFWCLPMMLGLPL